MNTTHTIDDAHIVSLLFSRDEAALRLIDEQYRSLLLGIMQHILRDTQDAEECLNDTYLDAWNTIPPARPRVLGAYLVTIARRRALDAYRRRTRQKRGGQAQPLSLQEDIGTATAQEVQNEENARHIGELLNGYLHRQSDSRRRIFLSYYYLHRSSADIAHAMGLSRSAVQKQLASIKRELRTLFESEDITL
jgi:RNA polymerase sigma-70 factor (ECF subfamily)